MNKKLKKVFALIMTFIMFVCLAQLNPVAASENTGGRFAHNLAATQIPFIYCYTNNDGTKKLNGSDTVVPKNTYYMYIYIKSTNIDVDTKNSKITINGQDTKVSWGTANDGYYTTAAFSTSSTSFNDININIKHSYKRNFSVRARKIITSNSSGAAEMEKILNENPATYQLYDSKQTVYLEGTINTAIDSYTNFIHWKQISKEGKYITDDDTYIRNLPNGEYTLMEMDSGKGLKTEDKTSNSVWLDSSLMKESKGKKYYTFTINDETVNQWMDACVNKGQSNSLFYGFYLENLKTSFNVSYDGNGYNQGMMKSHTNIKANDTIKLFENQYIRWGYTFAGWNTVANPTQENPGVSYADLSEMVVKQDTVLYAQWKKDLKVSHNVYIQDNSRETDNIKLVGSKTSIDAKLAFSQEELDTILSNNLIKGYKYIETNIEVKNDGSDVWETYQPEMNIKNKAQVRYVIIIDKNLQQTKELSYNVEHWIDGENTPRDVQKISSKVWINEENTELEVKEILLNSYDGYEFSHYDPIQLPTIISTGSTIKVYYKKIQTPIIPEEPTNPDGPEIPDVPTVPDTPNVPDIIVPPIVPIRPVTPPQNNVVENVTRNPNVNIEDNEIPRGNDQTENIEDTKVPQASGKSIDQGAWALINLICVCLTILIAFLALILKNRKEENKKDSAQECKDNEIYVRRKWTKGLSVIIAIISVIIFILTEDMSLPMVMTDKWTIVMVVIVLVQSIIYFISTRYKKDENNREGKIAYNQ